MSSSPSSIFVETRGVKIPEPEFCCQVSGRNWRFILEGADQHRQPFHLGLFVNNSAYSRDVDQYPFHRRACALFESPINPCYRDPDLLARRFPVVLTHQRELLNRGAPFVPLVFGTNWIAVRDQADTVRIRNDHPKKTKLVSFIGSLAHANDGAYSFRRIVAEHLRERGDVDCFGKGLNEIPAKPPAIAPYCFSIAMENAVSDHYFSEKLVDCILLETVPIYFGCPGISDLFDPRGLLCFNTLDELTQILRRATYELYDELRPFVLANKAKLIDRGWHSHQALFTRIASHFEQRRDFVNSKPVPRRGRIGHMIARIVNRSLS